MIAPHPLPFSGPRIWKTLPLWFVISACGGTRIFHVLHCHTSKKTLVSFSSNGAEQFASRTSMDTGSIMDERHPRINNSQSALRFLISVDSHGLYSNIIILHEGHDYYLRPTFLRKRDSFEVGEISVMKWIPGRQSLVTRSKKLPR